MAIQIASTIASTIPPSDVVTHETPQAEAGAAVLRDMTAPLPRSEARLFEAVGGAAVHFRGSAYSGVSQLAQFWRDVVRMREIVWVLPSTLYSARSGTALATRVARPDWFSVEPRRGPPAPDLPLRTNLRGPPGVSRVFGVTSFNAHGVFVATATHADPFPPRSRGDERNHDVFRQAKMSEILVHEVAVHAIPLLARRWDSDRDRNERILDHYDGWSTDAMRNPAVYRTPFPHGIDGRAGLLRDCNPSHLERGFPLEEQAYMGVTMPSNLYVNDYAWAPSFRDHRDRASFLRAQTSP